MRRTSKAARFQLPGALELRAYHEAGHAVAAALQGFSIARVSIARQGGYGGSCVYRPRHRAGPGGAGRASAPLAHRTLRRLARAAASVALAGSVAQDACALEHGFVALDLRTGLPFPLFSAGADADARNAWRVARALSARGGAQRAFLAGVRTTTERLLGAPDAWSAVRALARALLRTRTVQGADAERIIRAALGSGARPQRRRRRGARRTRGARRPARRRTRRAAAWQRPFGTEGRDPASREPYRRSGLHPDSPAGEGLMAPHHLGPAGRPSQCSARSPRLNEAYARGGAGKAGLSGRPEGARERVARSVEPQAASRAHASPAARATVAPRRGAPRLRLIGAAGRRVLAGDTTGRTS